MRRTTRIYVLNRALAQHADGSQPMPTTLTIYDETSSGERTGELTLDFLTERVTAREIIRARVYQEVTERNAQRALRPAAQSHTQFQPEAIERLLNGERAARGADRLD